MSRILLLTWRYMTYNRIKSLILLVCLTITLFLPLALHALITFYEQDLARRARSTPLLLGAKGDRYDLVLKSLYFRGDSPAFISAEDWDRIREQERGTAIPLHLGFTARKKPLVGTTIDYFDFRKLRPVEGTVPQRLGDAVLGFEAARDLGLGAGDWILTDQTSLYNIASTYPLQMRVAGVLAESRSPDDEAVFVDYKTAWIIAGIGHGHTDLTKKESAGYVLEKRKGQVVGNPAVVEYTKITDDNIDSFHFHALRANLPLTAVVVVPDSSKSSTLLKGRYSLSKSLQLLVPERIIEELMGIVFQVKKFFDSSYLLVVLATGLFLILVVLLSLQIRKRERRTLFHIGCSRRTVFWIQTAELAIILLASAALAGGSAVVLRQIAPRLAGML